MFGSWVLRLLGDDSWVVFFLERLDMRTSKALRWDSEDIALDLIGIGEGEAIQREGFWVLQRAKRRS